MIKVIAFHGKQETKDFYLARVKNHRLADEIAHGYYWEDGKGCAVGCTIHGSDHKAYESELGIPEWLAHLEDTLFENLKNGKAKLWPERFLSAIKPGADLEKIKTPFLIFILESSLESLDKVEFDKKKFPDVEKAIQGSREAVQEMIRCHRAGVDLSAAESAARSAARSAESAARSAESAARSAARSAESAAWSAARSAWSAARSAESAASAEFEKFADKLIELMENCD